MTCRELHSYFQGNLHGEINAPSASAEMAEHVGRCPECNRFVEGQKELTTNLRLVRDSAPPIPRSLDNAVVANYRRYVLERSCRDKSVPVTKRISPRAVLGWAAALAITVIVAYGGIVLFSPREQVLIGTHQQGTAERSTVLQAPSKGNNSAGLAQTIMPKAPNLPHHRAKRTRGAVSVAQQDDSLPTGFRSLLYCDQISCAGAMDVIRVQLPSSVLGLTPASARTNSAVFADVMVGPDGIARGIRVVE